MDIGRLSSVSLVSESIHIMSVFDGFYRKATLTIDASMGRIAEVQGNGFSSQGSRENS